MKKQKLLVGLAISFLLCSCSPQNPPPPPSVAPPVPEFRHTVRHQGETLASIARWYTGSSNQWQSILDANPTLNPRKIRLGTEVVIPNHLLVRTDPPPKPSGTKVAKKKEIQTPSAAETSPTADAPISAVGADAPFPEELDLNDAPPAMVAQDPPSLPSVDQEVETPPTDSFAVDVAQPPLGVASGEAADAPPAAPEQGGESNGGIVGGLLEAVGKVSIESKKQNAPAGQ